MGKLFSYLWLPKLMFWKSNFVWGIPKLFGLVQKQRFSSEFHYVQKVLEISKGTFANWEGSHAHSPNFFISKQNWFSNQTVTYKIINLPLIFVKSSSIFGSTSNMIVVGTPGLETFYSGTRLFAHFTVEIDAIFQGSFNIDKTSTNSFINLFRP